MSVPREARPRARSTRWLHLAAFALSAVTGGMTNAAAYRCDDAGRVTYTNLPCPVGKQTELTLDQKAPSPADQAAAQARQRTDQARLATLEKERHQDERAAAVAAKKGADRGKQANACTKLSLRAKRAREDRDQSNARDRSAKQTRLRRAEEDYAALCRKR